MYWAKREAHWIAWIDLHRSAAFFDQQFYLEADAIFWYKLLGYFLPSFSSFQLLPNPDFWYWNTGLPFSIKIVLGERGNVCRVLRVRREARGFIYKDDFLFNLAMALGKPGDFMKSSDFFCPPMRNWQPSRPLPPQNPCFEVKYFRIPSNHRGCTVLHL